jgi:hypothetical protein
MIERRTRHRLWAVAPHALATRILSAFRRDRSAIITSP